MKALRIFTFVMICLLPSLVFAGKAYYVDPSQTDPFEDGSYDHPWNGIDDVNSFKFKTGDDVYFKVGSSLNVPENTYLKIHWSGNENDQVIIGAYSGRGLFGLNGGERPIFDGNFAAPGKDSALIRCSNQNGYVTIKDLQVQNSNWHGIEISYGYTGTKNLKTVHNKVINCYTKNTVGRGIILYRASYGSIENNIVERASYNFAPGGGIVVSGSNNENVTHYNKISGNKVYWCYEGIGIYLGARYTIAENNIVFDCRSYHLYVANARDAVIRNNIVFETPNQLPGDGRDLLIGSDSEGHIDKVIKVTGGVEISGNFVAGGLKGIALMSKSNHIGLFQKDNKIYDNIIVDCDYNFHFDDTTNWSNNEIKNNISYALTDGTRHSNNFSPDGVIWDNNIYNYEINGQAANNAHIGFFLIKKSGWRTLKADDVKSSTFNLNNEGQAKFSVNSYFDFSKLNSPKNVTVRAN